MEEKHSIIKILEELKNIISADKNMDYNYIALFYYLKMIANKNEEYNKMKKQYAENICFVLQIDYGNNVDVIIPEFDYEKKELIMNVRIDSDIRKVSFYKNDKGEIAARRDNFGLGYEILSMMDSNILKLYNDMLLYESFIVEGNRGIKIGDTNFYADVSYDKVIIYYGEDKLSSEFILEIDSSLNYTYRCSNEDLINQFKNNEDQLLKKLDVDVELLPEWTHSTLYSIKTSQILAEKERKKEELRAQKRSEFFAKVTSVFKKR